MNQITIEAHVAIRGNILYRDGLEICRGNDTDSLLRNARDLIGLQYPKFFKMDRMSQLGIVACEFLLENSTHSIYDKFKKALIFQNDHASLPTDQAYSKTMKQVPSPALFVYTLPNIVLGEIAIKHTFKGENTFFISEKFNAPQLAQYITILFQKQVADLVICGWISYLAAEPGVMLCIISRKADGTEFSAEALNDLYTAYPTR